MAYCVQCGEPLSLDAKTCPACKRPVGLSSIGRALERLPSRAAVSAAKILGVVAALCLLATGVLWLAHRPGKLSDAGATEAAAAAARSIVRVRGAADSEGVLVRRTGAFALVATRASAAPAGRAALVIHGTASAPGLSVLCGTGRMLADLALVAVPDASRVDAPEVRSAATKVDETVLAVAAGGAVPGRGHVLSFEDGPGAGTLVHDAPMSDEAGKPCAFGIFGEGGRLVALPVFAPGAGEGLAVAASALLERLLAREVALDPRVEWAELPFPVEAGTQVAVFAAAAGVELQARAGGGSAAFSSEPAPAMVLAPLAAEAKGMLQVGVRRAPGAAPVQALVVALAPL